MMEKYSIHNANTYIKNQENTSREVESAHSDKQEHQYPLKIFEVRTVEMEGE